MHNNPIQDALESKFIPPHLAKDHSFLMELFREGLRRADYPVMCFAATSSFNAGPALAPGAPPYWDSVLADLPMDRARMLHSWATGGNQHLELARRIAATRRHYEDFRASICWYDREALAHRDKNMRFASLPHQRHSPPLLGVDFSFADLSQNDFLLTLDLSGCIFRGATLNMARIANTTAKTKVDGCDFSGANLYNACLTDVEGGDVNFSGANLDQAKMRGAKLQLARFSGASGPRLDLSGADIEGAQFDGGANLRLSSFTTAYAPKCNFSGALLMGLTANRAHFVESDFRGANLRDADFTRANLAHCNFGGAQLARAVFIGASLEDVDLREHDLSSCIFGCTDLTGAKMPRGFDVEAHMAKQEITPAQYSEIAFLVGDEESRQQAPARQGVRRYA